MFYLGHFGAKLNHEWVHAGLITFYAYYITQHNDIRADR